MHHLLAMILKIIDQIQDILVKIQINRDQNYQNLHLIILQLNIKK